jgi:hypothetical protein
MLAPLAAVLLFLLPSWWRLAYLRLEEIDREQRGRAIAMSNTPSSACACACWSSQEQFMRWRANLQPRSQPEERSSGTR